MKISSTIVAACYLSFTALLFSASTARAQSAVDERAILETVSALDAALDAKEWGRVRELLLDEVTLELPGQDAATVPADEAVNNWQVSLHPDKLTFHLRGGEQVMFDGADSVVVRSKAHVLTQVAGVAGDDLHEIWSDYHHELDRTENGWRVRHYGFVPRLERGNIGVVQHQLVSPLEAVAAEAAPSEDAPAAEPGETDSPTPSDGEPEVPPAGAEPSMDVLPDASDETTSDAPGDAEPADTAEASEDKDGG